MTERTWFKRHFELGLPPEALPDLLERLSRAPERLADAVGEVSAEELGSRPGDRWSIAEQAGHLGDLEPLWLGRVEDLVNGEVRLRSADLENRATWTADHNTRAIADILTAFRIQRGLLVKRVGLLAPDQLRATALHPRLELPMTVVDLCFFVAEHDDHHLQSIAELRASDRDQ